MKSFAAILSLTTAISVAATAFGHERQEIAGMQVVFGGEPEPVLEGELCFLRWRFTDLESKEPVTDLEEVQATIEFGGKEFGPFEARSSRRDPGMYQTHHIFTKSGEGEVVLRLKKPGADEVLEVRLPFRVGSRKSIEIP